MNLNRPAEKQKEADALWQYFRYALSQGKVIAIPVVDAETNEERWMVVVREKNNCYPIALMLLGDPREVEKRYPAMVCPAPSATPLKDALERTEKG